MSAPNIPYKTETGRSELSRRSHGLSQRHRTVLLLIDGVRPLSEVLSLAQQAGASVQHFEELMRLELVALPAMPTLEVLPEPDSAFDSTSGSHAQVDLDLAAVEAEATSGRMPLDALPAQPGFAPVVAPVVAPVPPPRPASKPRSRSAPAPRKDAAPKPPAARPAPAKPSVSRAPSHVEPVVLDAVAEPGPVIEVDLAPPPPAEAPRRPPPTPASAQLVGDDLVVHEVRELLLASIESLPPKHRLRHRLQKATTIDHLVDVIELVERLVRRQGGAAQNAQLASDMLFARDLLGLGNTRFIETDGFEATRPR